MTGEDDFIVDVVRDMRVDVGRQTEGGARDAGCHPPKGSYDKVAFFFEKYHHLGAYDMECAQRAASVAHFLALQAYARRTFSEHSRA